MLRRSLFLALWLLTPLACVDDAEPCAAGSRCICGLESVCAMACEGQGCDFVCPPSARCAFECDSGNCQATCSESLPCDMSCKGGGCTMRCTNNAYCDMHDCPDCVLECDATSTCRHDK
jgi:hypothetical protein